MKTVLEILKLSTEYLQQHDIHNPRRQAEELISDTLGVDRLQLYLQFERPLNEAELDFCRKRLLRRAKGEPLQYINGTLEFLDCQINVTPAVLIPRQETEILVDKIAKELSALDLEGKTLWDVCCGSGCIGIALKKKFPLLKVTLSDVSTAALQVAKENAELNEVEVSFLQGDLLEPFAGQQTHFLVCNPPYIAENEFQNLEKEVRDFEPRMALVAGKSGMEYYERLAKDLPMVLYPGSKVWFEIGTGQGKAVSNLFKTSPWKQSRVELDWAGHDRFFFLEIE